MNDRKTTDTGNGKKIGLWVLTVFFGILALGAFSAGDILSALFAALFIALIIPIDEWQAQIRKFIKGKLKSVVAVIMAILCFACAGSGAGDTPDIDLDNPAFLATDIWTIPTTDSTSESTTVPTTNSTTESTTNSIVNITEPTAEPSTAAPTDPTIIPEDSTFSIHFIDVGQADAALVECDGHYMLIDGGNKADSSRIYSVLKKTGVEKLDIVVGTHAHEDHIGGLPGAFSYTYADLTLCPVASYDSDAFEDFARMVNAKGGGITIPSVGSTYSLGSSLVKILGVNGGSDTNDTSIILRIDYGDTSFLFTGDAEREAEQTVLNSGTNLAATVLKVGHHGSDTSTTYPFLREIMPQYAVISVGQENSYGHPTEDTLSRLRDADVTVFRTDLQGDIYCTSDGKTVTFSVTRNANADVFDGIGGNSNQTEPTEPSETDPPETEPEEDVTMVWIPQSGKKYHSYSGCSNMKNPREVTEEEAKAMGYTPCKRCH